MRRALRLFSFFLAASCFGADLTGNWVVEKHRGDGTVDRSYFNLKQEASRITGTIRVTQFFYTISDGSGTPEHFTLIGSMKDGNSERHVTYEGRLAGDQLHLATRRGPDSPLTELTARRAPSGEGAMPSRLPLPALHRVPDNGLAKTPPMGWNSWNNFKNKVSDEVVRQIADAMVSSGMRDAGYSYINIDDTWEGQRDAKGNITSNQQEPEAWHLLLSRS